VVEAATQPGFRFPRDALCCDVLEGAPISQQRSLGPCKGLPAANDDIDAEGIELDGQPIELPELKTQSLATSHASATANWTGRG
jgi:hypothetical protein